MRLIELEDYSKFKAPKLPIVLCHGLLGFDRLLLFDYWRGIQKDLEDLGCKVIITRVPPTEAISVRAEYLASAIEHLIEPKEETDAPATERKMHYNQVEALQRNIAWDESIPVKKVHLVAHSMGGLDSRYYINKLGGSKYVHSLLTIGTPHRGSMIADWLQSPESLLTKIQLEPILKLLGVKTSAFKQLTTTYLKEFNEEIKDDPNVQYFSISGGAVEVAKWNALRPFFKKLYDLEGPNDGLVSVESAKWGTFLGSIEADHLEQINWNWLKDNKSIYRNIATFLARVEDKTILAPPPSSQ